MTDMNDILRNHEEYFKSKYPVRYWIDYKLFRKRKQGILGYAPHVLFLEPWKIIEEIGHQIKWAWQRVFRGWDDRVIWDIGTYLSRNMPIWIERLKDDKQGIPIDMFDGLPHDENYGYSPEDTEVALKRWDDVLTKIGVGFVTANLIGDYHLYNTDDYDAAMKIYNEGMDAFRDHFFSLWD